MLMCVRTTIDIPDALLSRARERALAQGTTLRAVVADALRSALEGRADTRPEGLAVPTYGGSGLTPGVEEADLFAREERDPPGPWQPQQSAGG